MVQDKGQTEGQEIERETGTNHEGDEGKQNLTLGAPGYSSVLLLNGSKHWI